MDVEEKVDEVRQKSCSTWRPKNRGETFVLSLCWFHRNLASRSRGIRELHRNSAGSAGSVKLALGQC